MGAALLDPDEPEKVICRSKPYLLAPGETYERVGDVPNVIFPCAALEEDDKIVIYYGAADTVVAIAFGYISGIIDFLKINSL